jgi:hypothetical protein
MNERKRAWRWFWPWEDGKEELWLEEMARSGWHFNSGPLPWYTFAHGEPANVRYRLDYRNDTKGMDEYLALFRDAGWERIQQYSGWQYFRTSNPDAPEIYTDDDSKIGKYQRLMRMLCLIAFLLLSSNLPMLCGMWQIHPEEHWPRILQLSGILVLYALWGYILLRLGLYIRTLKRQSQTDSLSPRAR